MEAETLDISLISSTHLSSSWPITRSSLDDVITCESSFSAVDSPSDSDPTPLPSRKPPLILCRPSPDSPPCEITILFTQQHEIKQVYVRSTARVYEIYCAADKKGDNEYLCTVRCGVAARIEEQLQEFDGVESLSNSSNSNQSSCEEHFRSESAGSANDDGWVDVKVQNPSTINSGDVCPANKDESCMERGNQDFFEATAEISDVDPVLSVTLRLLSIQSGDFIFIDEIYVFADPVVSADTNSSTSAQGTSTESATMSLLIPTLLNLSKLRRNQKQEQMDIPAGGRKHQDDEHKSNSEVMMPSTSRSETIQGVMLNNASVAMSEADGRPVQRPVLQTNPYSTSEKNDIICSRIEKTLDELVSRVAKIEHFCLRMEENMLKPISNMEARLERIEQQLDSSKFSMTAHTSHNRISAPEFSCTESESNSVFTGGNDSLDASNLLSIKKNGSDPQDLSISSSDANSLVSVPLNDVALSGTNQLIPSLVVTAPDFSYVDDEEELDTIEEAKDSPKGTPKKPFSIDDALAFALAGFMSSASIDTGMVEETADISCKEGTVNPCSSELIHTDDHIVPSSHVDRSYVSNEDLVGAEQEAFVANNIMEEATESVDEHSLLSGKGDKEKPLGNSICNVVNLDPAATKINNLSMDVCTRAADDDSNQTFGFCSSDSSDNDTSVPVLDVPADDIDSTYGEETTKESPLLNILNLQSPAVLDFDTSILDVKFSSQESFSANSSLDALLVDVPQPHSEASCVEEDIATSSSEQHDLVMIGNVDSTTCVAPPNNHSFDLDNLDSSCMPPDMREEELQDPCKCSIQDAGASLI